jgi:hypothetical protein
MAQAYPLFFTKFYLLDAKYVKKVSIFMHEEDLIYKLKKSRILRVF